MRLENILVLLPVNDRQKAMLREKAPGATFVFQTAGTVTAEQMAQAEAIIGNPPAQLLPKAARLRWLQLNSAGADAYLHGALPAGAVMTNATGAYGLAISEHLLAMLLSLLKNLPFYRDNQRQSLWKDGGPARSVYGSQALVVGLGDIGGEFARRLQALGASVTGVRRTDNAEVPPYVDRLVLADQLDDWLPTADIVALCLPGTQETTHLFSAQRIARMKPGAILLNVGRGSAIDTNALCDALESGRLSGAGLDVTDPEPLPADHRLWQTPGALITPHVSGGFHLRETFERIVAISAENLGRLVADQPLRNQVDFSTGYRTVASK